MPEKAHPKYFKSTQVPLRQKALLRSKQGPFRLTRGLPGQHKALSLQTNGGPSRQKEGLCQLDTALRRLERALSG